MKKISRVKFDNPFNKNIFMHMTIPLCELYRTVEKIKNSEFKLICETKLNRYDNNGAIALKMRIYSRLYDNIHECIINSLVLDAFEFVQDSKYFRNNHKVKCAICGYNKILQTHHIKPVAFGGTNEKKNLIKLCPNCHCLIHHKNYFIKKIGRKYVLKEPINRKFEGEGELGE